LLLVQIALWQTGCHKKTESAGRGEPPVARVRVQTVEAKSHVAIEDVVGTVRAKLRAALEAKVSGRLEKLLVSPGQTVKGGELLAQLDAREIQARLDQTLALRDQLKRDTDRLQGLLVQSAISRQEFETVESRYRVAAAAAAEAETMLGYTKIVAPFDGVVTRKLADVGDLASPGKPLLEIEDPSLRRLEADVPESLIDRIRPGATFLVHAPGLSEIMATASEIAPAADPATRSFLVKFDLPAGTGLRSGQFARVAISVNNSPALRVRASAVLKRGQMEIVFVVTNHTAWLRLVKTGSRVGDEIELISGVDPGEQVVTEGAASLTDGQRVEAK
jgi:RND family efflux transporter MFP subunit